MRAAAALLLFVLPAALHGQPGLRIGSAVSADTVTVGDTVRLSVRVAHAPGTGVTLRLPAAGDVEPADSAWREVERSDTGFVATLHVVLWRTGTPAPLSVPLAVRTAGGEARVLEAAAALPHVRSVLPADTTLHRPRPPKDILAGTPRETGIRAVWLALAAIAALLAVALVLAARRRPPPGPRAGPAGSADDSPAALLRRARAEALPRGDWRALYALLADALRAHAAARSDRWTRDLTTAELAVRAAPSAEWVEVLRTADAVRFGRASIDPARAEHDLSRAEHWIAAEDAAGHAPSPPASARRARRRWAAGVLLLSAPLADEADRAFRSGDHARAAALYARALEQGDASDALRYNLGTALLSAGEHDAARTHFDAIGSGAAPVLRQRARYNAGNTDLEPAYAPGAMPAREPLERAVAAYRAALRLDAGDLDAKWNLELAQRLLDRLPESGGGGGGSGGGGEGGTDAPADAPPRPRGAGGEAPDLTPQQAAALLQDAVDREQAVQQERLQRREPPPPRTRDW